MRLVKGCPACLMSLCSYHVVPKHYAPDENQAIHYIKSFQTSYQIKHPLEHVAVTIPYQIVGTPLALRLFEVALNCNVAYHIDEATTSPSRVCDFLHERFIWRPTNTMPT